MEWQLVNWLEALEAIGAIIGGFALLATMTKNESDNKVFNWAMMVVNFLGANFGRARNDT